jgi:hypothetical protein
MAIDAPFGTLLRKRRRILHVSAAFPALLEKAFRPSECEVEPWLFSERRVAISLTTSIGRVLGLLLQRQLTWLGVCLHRHYCFLVTPQAFIQESRSGLVPEGGAPELGRLTATST